MTSRFFFFVLFFGSDVGGVVVVVVWRHPEALLFSVCVLADYTLSLVLFLDIYKMELEKCNRICLQFIFVTKRATNTLSRKQTTCFLGVVSDDDDSEESVVLFSSSLKVVSFLIHI